MRIKLSPLDKLFARYIKARDKYCQRCGGLGGLQTSHFFGRSMKSVRWDEENACLLCFGCHQYFHSHPLEHVDWFKARLGDRFDLLEGRMRIIGRPDTGLLTLYFQQKIAEVLL